MARPRIDANERHSECFSVRLTLTERLALVAEAERLNLTPTGLARQRITAGRVVIREHKKLDPRQAFELGRIGVNLNQIARVLNSGEAADLPEIAEALTELRRVLAELLTTPEIMDAEGSEPEPTRPSGSPNKPPTGAPRGS